MKWKRERDGNRFKYVSGRWEIRRVDQIFGGTQWEVHLDGQTFWDQRGHRITEHYLRNAKAKVEPYEREWKKSGRMKVSNTGALNMGIERKIETRHYRESRT